MKRRLSVPAGSKPHTQGRGGVSGSLRQSSESEPPSRLSTPPRSPLISKRIVLTCLALILACAVIYAPVRHFGFMTSWDDSDYVTDNAYVSQGLTSQGVAWAFTSMAASNWHPLTWLSHMLDVQLFGMDPGPQHVVNLLFHILNTLLLFGLLHRATGAWGRSAFVAGLFAVHPLHVESVAWIAERKDVLSAFLWLLAMWAYVSYARRPRVSQYLIVALLFGLGLLAKPMLVTLPFALLLLDFWPLRRVKFEGDGWAALRGRWRDVSRLVREKAPLMILAAASCIVTFSAQQRGGAVVTAASLSARLGNAAVSYVAYIGKMLWPLHLAAFYPARLLSVWSVSAGVGLLIGITILAVRAGQRRGFFLAGWLWYVGTLVPVIGIVQVGGQAMADRYTYIPSIGLFLIAAWGLPELLHGWRQRSVALSVAAVGALAVFAGLARAQVPYWSDGVALWRHALEATEDNPVANNNLGGLLLKQGQETQAIPYLAEALRVRPNYPEALNFMGMALMYQGQLDRAASYFNEALRVRPASPLAQDNLGAALMFQGKLDEAAPHVAEALRLRPDFADAHENMGRILAGRGQFDAAIDEYREALRLNPARADAQNDLGTVLARQGRIDEAIEHFADALRVQPGFEDASRNLQYARSLKGANGR